jgi:tripartite-type tricarboxylate transporter receptor subunit TctC
MSRRRLLLAGGAAALAAPAGLRAQGAAVTVIVAFAPGGPTDAVARILVGPFGRALGQNVVVENVGGSGGNIGAARAAQARPDGSVLLLHNIALATSPGLYRRLSFDPITDFEPIGLIATVPMVFVIRAGLPGVADFPAMLRFVRERGQGAVLAHAGLGSASHLCMTLLQAQLGVAATTIAFRGAGPVYPEMLGGRVDIYCDQTTSVLPQLQGERILAMAAASASRLPQLPDVPTTAEGGLAGFELTIWHGLCAPKGTPAAVVSRTNEALVTALQDPAVRNRLTELGAAIEPPDRVTPGAHRAHLAAEIARWRPILQAAGQFAD